MLPESIHRNPNGNKRVVLRLGILIIRNGVRILVRHSASHQPTQVLGQPATNSYIHHFYRFLLPAYQNQRHGKAIVALGQSLDNPTMSRINIAQKTSPLSSESHSGDGGKNMRGQHALPVLNRDPSFWSMAVTQFLGAFNDNIFKQLILLLATPTVAEVAAGTADDLQSQAQLVFAASFLIFSGFAGYLSDRFSKRPIVILSKAAEIICMLLGVVGFFYYDLIGFPGMLCVLFLMGTQSAFFGPSKYGILPETLRPTDLPRANGIFLMLTFLAIIFGMAAAGELKDMLDDQLWIASLVCVVIAILGTITAFGVRNVPPAQPDLEYRASCWVISKDTLALLGKDRELLRAMVAVAMFWLVGGMVLQTVNALGKSQLGLNERNTSLLAASIGIGTAFGCILGGYLSRNRVNRSIVIGGAFGTVAMLALLALPGGDHRHLLGFPGSMPALVLLGLFSGMFIVPVQVALQTRPPREEKGRMIATMNQLSWIGVILGALIYNLCLYGLEFTGGPRSQIFGATALLMLPVALFYRPKDERLATHSVEASPY